MKRHDILDRNRAPLWRVSLVGGEAHLPTLQRLRHVSHQNPDRRLPDRHRRQPGLRAFSPGQRQGQLETNGAFLDRASRAVSRPIHSAADCVVARNDRTAWAGTLKK